MGQTPQRGGRRARPVWSKPPVLCFLYPTAIHRSTLNLWLFLLQSGETALHVAARYGHADVVQLLCNFGSNPNFQDKEEETPLHCAAWHGYYSVAKALCEAGCNVNIKNREGETPLLTASARGYHDIVECVAEHGADLNASDKDGHIALHLAVRRCQIEVIQTLISQGCFVDFQDRHGNTPLHVACKDGNVPIVVALCEANCNLDISNKVKLEGKIPEGPIVSFCHLASGFGPSFSAFLHRTKSVLLIWTCCFFYRALHYKSYFTYDF